MNQYQQDQIRDATERLREAQEKRERCERLGIQEDPQIAQDIATYSNILEAYHAPEG